MSAEFLRRATTVSLILAVVACASPAKQFGPTGTRDPVALATAVPLPTVDPLPVQPPVATVAPEPPPVAPAATEPTFPPPTAPGAPPSTAPTVESTPVIDIPLRFETRTDEATAQGFADIAVAALTDPRGWQQAGFRFSFRPDAPYVVILAEPAETDQLCAPYGTNGQFSCQIGERVVLNAERWRVATTSWTASLQDYRTMLVNHEVGHLIGRHHARPLCGAAGQSAALMGQQSKGLDGCVPNPWPLPWEIACAARHDEPIAPGYEPTASATCGPGDV